MTSNAKNKLSAGLNTLPFLARFTQKPAPNYDNGPQSRETMFTAVKRETTDDQ